MEKTEEMSAKFSDLKVGIRELSFPINTSIYCKLM